MFILSSIFLLAIGFAVAGSLTFYPVTHGYDFYRPILLLLAGFVGAILLWAIISLIMGLFIDRKNQHDNPGKYSPFWLRELIITADFLAGVHIKVKNKSLMPNNEKFLLVSNHQSNFDPIVIVDKLAKQNIAFIAKKSTFKIPFAAPFMFGACYTAIDRNDPIQSLGVMKRCSKLISDNVSSVGVFPEGTRHKDGVIGDFHEGVFNIAIYTKAPIVIATVKNTNKVHKRFPLPTKVELNVLKVLRPDEYESMNAKAISDYAQNLMKEDLGQK